MKRVLVVATLVLVTGATEARAETFRYTLSNSTTTRSAADAKASAASIRARLAGVRGARVVSSRNRVRVSGISRRVARERVEPQGLLAIFDWEGSLIRSVVPKGKGCLVDTVKPAGTGVGRTTKAKAKARARACKVGGQIMRAQAGRGWYGLVRTEPISNQQITKPRVVMDPATSNPVIRFGLDTRGRKAFEFLTLTVARRGKLQGVAGAHHIAISIDDQLISTPFIDGDATPGGLDGKSGIQLTGGFSRARAERLVTLIKHPLAGPLQRVR